MADADPLPPGIEAKRRRTSRAAAVVRVLLLLALILFALAMVKLSG